ncbi:MAG: hypothetical protein AB8B72_00720 [Crocinitomicaceae bacterium]
MNKVINLFSLILLIIFGFFAIGSIYDLGFSVYEVNDIPYIKQIGYGLTLLILLLGIIRIKRRLEGRQDIKGYNGFVFSSPISKPILNSATVFLGIEIFFGAGVIIILSKIIPWDEEFLVLPMLIVVSLLTLENITYLIFLRKNPSNYKIGIGPQFIAYFDREMHIYYYKGLKRVEVYQGMINFRYKKDLNLFLNLDIIPIDEQKVFFNALQSTLSDYNIFFDDSYHQYIGELNK